MARVTAVNKRPAVSNITFNGVAQTASTSWLVAPQITGDIELVYCFSVPSPLKFGELISRYVGPNAGHWRWRIGTSTGRLDFTTTPDGLAANDVLASSTANLAIVPNVLMWIKVTRDVNNGAGGNDTKFYYAANDPTTFAEPTSWTQLGATVTNAGTTSILGVSASNINVGSFYNGGFGMWTHSVYRAIVRDGIDGTTRVDFNFMNTPPGASSLLDAAGKQTINIGAGGAIKGRISASGRVTI